MSGYGYINWKKCPFCDSDIEERKLLAHSVNDCEALGQDGE